MGVDVPDDYTIDLILSGGATINSNIAVTDMPDVNLAITQLPAISLGVTELPAIELRVTELPKIQLGVDPLDLSLRIKELPSIRAHLPANFKVGLTLLGIDLACIHLCGEAQIITEEYRPNPCEVCGPRGTTAGIKLVDGDG